MSLILGVIIGLAIGWSIPQPQAVKDLVAKIKASINK